MRFLETLLVVFAAIYVAQLVIAALLIAMVVMFLWCLYQRPKEALVLGLAVLLVAVISKPIGFLLMTGIALGVAAWSFIGWLVARCGRNTCTPAPRLSRP